MKFRKLIVDGIEEYHFVERFENSKSLEEYIQNLKSFIINENLIIINSYIFCFDKDLSIYDFLFNYPNTLVYSKFDNWYNIYMFAVRKSENLAYEYILNKENIFNWVFLGNKLNKSKYLYLDWIKFGNEDFSKQVSDTYDFIESQIIRYDFNKNDFVRAWNFIQDIYDNYSKFNVERNFFFDKLWINDYPAGTGIWALFDGLTLISSNFLFCKWETISHIPVIAKNQVQAVSYWPKFSRARLINFNDSKKLFISWTASVEKDGKWKFNENMYENISYTLETFGNLLKQSDLLFKDLKVVFLYFKKPQDLSIFEEIYKEKKLEFPYIYLYTDICQPYFMFEIEWIAAK